ncbi:MAG: prolipoprotein diacylglyceryl transferase [Nannocystis sp.]|uniref:prolipoprotein diacylglyceryl transferase n=1 Tax=Nannocystis sp. TaxID=1962667 RepID=UPI0024266540|nr:prolipoprotein diacylglyceryl transferase family protein [Nannocystis sp.]MBK9757101.1 prolipoprotein diacylglyceryl transferase [Nannocystis sp.]
MLEALIPYLRPPEKLIADLPVIGPLKLQFFGPLVAAGVILGYHRCLHYAKKKNIDEFIARDMMFWVLVTGFVISHWVSVLFYFPEDVAANPLVLIMVWNGLSSVGGFFGALVGMIWYLRKMKQPYLVYVDMLMYGLLVGFTMGRLGCSLVHDHPGSIVDASHILAVGPWPDGQYRLDLGLLEFMYLVPITLYVHLVYNWEKARPGVLLGTVALLYAPYRFILDTMREKDKLYLGLTTAQYSTLIILAAGIYLVFIRKPRPEDNEWARDSDRAARELAAKAAAPPAG